MLSSHSPEEAYEAARRFYMERGYLPLDVSIDLSLSGFIVDDLERKWDRRFT